MFIYAYTFMCVKRICRVGRHVENAAGVKHLHCVNISLETNADFFVTIMESNQSTHYTQTDWNELSVFLYVCIMFHHFTEVYYNVVRNTIMWNVEN